MKIFRHVHDIGTFVFVKDNGDGTGVFRKEKGLLDSEPRVIGSDLYTYFYSEMTSTDV